MINNSDSVGPGSLPCQLVRRAVGKHPASDIHWLRIIWPNLNRVQHRSRNHPLPDLTREDRSQPDRLIFGQPLDTLKPPISLNVSIISAADELCVILSESDIQNL